jgi:hypothetical protein
MSSSCRACVGAALMLFVAGCGGGGAATPDAAFKDFQAAFKAKDGEKAWNLMSKDAQAKMEEVAKGLKKMLELFDKLPADARKAAEEKAAKESGMTLDELKSLDGKRLFVTGIKAIPADKLSEVTGATLENVKIDGEKATASIKSGSKTEPIRFVKESGSWKIADVVK